MVSLECLEKDKKCIFVAERLFRPLFVLWTETILFLGDILKLRVLNTRNFNMSPRNNIVSVHNTNNGRNNLVGRQILSANWSNK